MVHCRDIQCLWNNSLRGESTEYSTEPVWGEVVSVVGTVGSPGVAAGRTLWGLRGLPALLHRLQAGQQDSVDRKCLSSKDLNASLYRDYN